MVFAVFVRLESRTCALAETTDPRLYPAHMSDRTTDAEDPVTSPASAPAPAALRTAFAQIVRDSLWPVALGMGGIYAFTAVSHGLRLEPAVRLPLTLYAAVTAVFFIVAALLLLRRPASLRWLTPWPRASLCWP